ncbi:MAG: response regulator, partial [Desulfobacteraceae bacterium]|nr:response regulator [Desulfobacteraceae bacterium]
DFSKIDAGKMDIENIDFKLNDVMDSLSDMFSTKTAEKEIEFVISISKDVPSNLMGDPLRLRQALINLTGNAVKFTKKGEIIVSVSSIESTGDHSKLEFAIKDTGIGIPENRLNKLFNSFVQADGSTTRNFGGTGLGLSISKKLIELMGGNIVVKSEEGKGSTFSFYLTFKKKDKKAVNRFNFNAKLKGMKVLVVDDNEAARDIMYETLSSFRFNVKTVDSGMRSLEELIKANNEDSPYKLILLDLIMPGMDGLETVKIIRKNHNISKIPIIIMTAFGREEVMQQTKKAGVNAFLMKPVKQSILLDTIMNIFDKKATHTPVIKEVDTPKEFAQLNGLNVLLVEDNKINQLVASRILEEAYIKVTIASTGLEAVQLLETTRFDLVLMDIQMPEMDGYSATGEIRNKLKLKDLPIIAMTAHAMAGDKEKCIKAGMDDYISKPIDPDFLYSKLIEFSPPDMSDPMADPPVHKKEAPSKKASNNLSNNLPNNFPDYL